MNKVLVYFLFLLFISNCSLDTKSGFWTEKKSIKKEKNLKKTKIFKEDEVHQKEFNTPS